MAEKYAFAEGDYVVYPAHGVGKVEKIEVQEIAGFTLEVFVIHFEDSKLTLRVPVGKAKASGLRSLSTTAIIGKALDTLKMKARVRRTTMWSRRAQEYETKINSGDPVSIAEVIRDLHRNETEGEQSYSERQLYEAALERLTREVAIINKIDETKAAARLHDALRVA